MDGGPAPASDAAARHARRLLRVPGTAAQVLPDAPVAPASVRRSSPEAGAQERLHLGMPGSSWEHHDGPFQVPKHFRLVYRLHEMVLGANDIINPETGELLDR